MPVRTKTIDRSKVNQNSVVAPDPQKSGFNLGYNDYRSFIIGKLTPSASWTMPGDKLLGSNVFNGTLRNLVTPMVTPLTASIHDIFIPLRALDRTFEDAFSPHAANGMSANWVAPHFSLKSVFNHIITDFNLSLSFSAAGTHLTTLTATDVISVNNLFQNLTMFGSHAPNVVTAANNFYLSDFVSDYNQYLLSLPKAFSTSTKREDVVRLFLNALRPIIGKNSLLDFLGFNYLRPIDIDTIARKAGNFTNMMTHIAGLLDDMSFNEYAIRAYYAAWFELYRVDSVEPKNSNLANWKDFGSASVVDAPYGWMYLVLRSRSWMEDMFTSAQVDDISRHVYAPIFADSTSEANLASEDHDFLNASSPSFDTQLNNYQSVNIRYINTDGSSSIVSCPLPSRINDFISRSNTALVDVYGLDLMNLKQAFALESYLKRCFYFKSDDYINYILGIYGSKVSDLRINKPELVGSCVGDIRQSQQIANISAGDSTVGDRVAVAEIGASGDGFSFYSEEFGILINMLSIMPVPQYCGVTPQNMMSRVVDFPIPQFAQNNEEFGRIVEISSNGLKKSDVMLRTFGHYSYAHAWRGRVNEVHGDFVDDLASSTFARFWNGDTDVDIPKLNSHFMKCLPNLQMFADTVRLNGQVYGDITHNLVVERVLPVPVEVI